MAERKPKPGQEPAEAAVTVVETRPSSVWEGVTYVLSYNSKFVGGRRQLSPNPYWRAHWRDPKTGKNRSKYIGLKFDESKLKESDF